MKRRLLAAFSAGLFLAVAARAEDFGERLRALEPTMGHYPADIDKNNAADVKARYEALKADLDKGLAQNPGDEKLLAQRGFLQAMGHNADYAGAWEGGTKDLTAALENWLTPEMVRAPLLCWRVATH